MYQLLPPRVVLCCPRTPVDLEHVRHALIVEDHVDSEELVARAPHKRTIPG
eukprot:CAMPEP_0119524614 /NCGR_PEP_ID=MMETSP1344-20130328/39529_1 /TAXON_ID=236787 /ORGANISM="Florenciella parvula, Strain CCMP2471" /LENGTH=50 /DNA_ID=CAMNT_0007563169 /DNA_START=472 /DNA_END=624 /DNA_ORIENTATION=-